MAEVPAYFEGLIAAFRKGKPGRYVHLGHWDQPPDTRRNAPRDPGEFLRAQARLDQVLIGMAGIADGESVLDIGCGLGGTVEAISRQRLAMRLVGFNVDPRQLEVCRSLVPAAGNSFTWTEGDACDLPYPEASFDRVLSIEAMFHFRSRRRFFAEAARVLRPGGRLAASDIVLTPDARRLVVPRFAVAAMLVDGFGPWPDVWSDDADHRALAAAAGLDCTELRDASAETLPSYAFTLPAGIDETADPRDPMLRAGLMLRWLQRNGLARYIYMAFDKAR